VSEKREFITPLHGPDFQVQDMRSYVSLHIAYFNEGDLALDRDEATSVRDWLNDWLAAVAVPAPEEP
jgi:hypothetical protein